MLAIAAFYEIWQMDVKTAFLDGFIKGELYMTQPEGFLNPKVLTKCASPSDPSITTKKRHICDILGQTKFFSVILMTLL